MPAPQPASTEPPSPPESGAATASKIAFKDIRLKPFGVEDLDALPALLLDCLGRDEPASWLRWKFFENPFGGALGFVVAYHGDRLVGFIGANPVPFSLDGELSMVYQHQDTAIAEDARSLALLRGMTKAAESLQGEDSSVRLTYSITTPHMRELVTKRMKYTVVWENLKMVKLLSLRGYVSKATRSAALTRLMPGPMGRSFKAPSSMTGEVRALARFGPEFDEFWKHANRPGDEIGRIFPWQDSRWLNYKFFGDEVVTFEPFAYFEGGKVIGYLVLNVTRLDVRIGYIDALWALPGRQDVVALLSDFALATLTQRKCDQVSCWTRPDAPLGKALADRGLQVRPTPQCLSIKQLAPGMGDLGLVGSHWNLQRGHTYYTSLGHLSAEAGQQRLYKAKAARDEERSRKLRGKSGD